MLRLSLAALGAAWLLMLAPASATAAIGHPPPAPTSLASFEGRTIDLSTGWGEAKACRVAGGATACFRDRAGMLASEPQSDSAPALTAAASCGSPLRLFASGNYGGRELDFYDRGYWQNLSTWSFSNQVSSYKVGGCGVYLADGASGSGSWYPGNGGAGHWEPSMLSGWNDRISSIFIQ